MLIKLRICFGKSYQYLYNSRLYESDKTLRSIFLIDIKVHRIKKTIYIYRGTNNISIGSNQSVSNTWPRRQINILKLSSSSLFKCHIICFHKLKKPLPWKAPNVKPSRSYKNRCITKIFRRSNVDLSVPG